MDARLGEPWGLLGPANVSYIIMITVQSVSARLITFVIKITHLFSEFWHFFTLFVIISIFKIIFAMKAFLNQSHLRRSYTTVINIDCGCEIHFWLKHAFRVHQVITFFQKTG